MSVGEWRKFRLSRALTNKALPLICLGVISLYLYILGSSSVANTEGSLINIDWAMSPGQVLEATKDYSRHTKIIEKGRDVTVMQRERITDSDIAGKSLVEYTFSNNRLKKIKITKAIKYWPDFILEQLLHETVPGYMVGYVMETLYNHNVYMAESDYESTVISLGYGKDNKPKYAYVEINSKI